MERCYVDMHARVSEGVGGEVGWGALHTEEESLVMFLNGVWRWRWSSSTAYRVLKSMELASCMLCDWSTYGERRDGSEGSFR